MILEYKISVVNCYVYFQILEQSNNFTDYVYTHRGKFYYLSDKDLIGFRFDMASFPELRKDMLWLRGLRNGRHFELMLQVFENSNDAEQFASNLVQYLKMLVDDYVMSFI